MKDFKNSILFQLAPTIIIVLLFLIFFTVAHTANKQKEEAQHQLEEAQHQLTAIYGVIYEISGVKGLDNVFISLREGNKIEIYFGIRQGKKIYTILNDSRVVIRTRRKIIEKTWEDYPKFHSLFNK